MQAASADATMLWFAALDGACADHARAKLQQAKQVPGAV
jgi:hypothetical protein